MAIKATAIGNVRQIQDFPKLMVSKSCGMIVLFDRLEHGIVLVPDKSPGLSGYGAFGFGSSSWDMTCFEPWSGKITIEQD